MVLGKSKSKSKPKSKFMAPTQSSIAEEPERIDVTEILKTPEQKAQEEQKKQSERLGLTGPITVNGKPANQQKQGEVTPPKVLQPQVIRNQETGEITGIKTPDGKVIMAGNKRESKELISTFSDNTPWDTPKGFVEAEDVAAAQQQFIQQQQAIQQLTTGELQQGAQPNVDLSEDPNAASAVLNPLAVAGGITAGATAGATVGALGGPVGSAVLGTIGGIVGGFTAFLGKLSSDKRQSTKEAYKVFTLATGERQTQLLNLANSGTIPPADVVFAYEQNLANIRAARASLQEKTRTLIGRQLSGAQDELIAVEMYLANEGYYRAQLMMALQSPNPSRIYTPVPLTEQNE